MSAEARYFRVGLFVFGGMVLIGSCAVVLGGRDLFKDTIAFETYFDESVTGLEVGSAVKLRGVNIGSVSEIGFVQNRYSLESVEDLLKYGGRVYVGMELTPPSGEAPDPEFLQRLIERGLRLRLSTAGLTGTSFIQADYLSPENYPPMEIAWTPKDVYVPSAPSTIATITSAAERIFRRLEEAQLEKVVLDLDKLLVTLNDQVGALDVAGLNAGAEHVLEQANASLVRTRRLLEGSEYDVQMALENLRVATENLRDLTDTAKQYPSLLILGEPPEPTEASAR